MRSLVVTVGSTRFDALIEALGKDLERFREMISLFQLDEIIIQYGKCEASIYNRLSKLPNVRLVDYLPPAEMAHLLSRAVIVIAHGGAGTAFEVLRANKQNLERFLMIENPSLMDSHQGELIDGLIGLGCPVIRGQLDDIFGSIADSVPSGHSSLPEPNTDILAQILTEAIK